MRNDVAGQYGPANKPNAGLASLIKIAGVGCCLLLVANCASSDKLVTRRGPDYGKASPRVFVGTGRIDPSISRHGVYMVGKPYTIDGLQYSPQENRAYSETGKASWYGDAFHGRQTANGEVFDMHDISAAHPTMPLPSYARVTNLANGTSLIVRVNDRGPYHSNRVLDVSSRAADLLGFKEAGIGQVKVEYVGPAKMRGSDEQMLMATLRTNGSAAPAPGERPISVAALVPPSNPLPTARPSLEPFEPVPAVAPQAGGSPNALSYAKPVLASSLARPAPRPVPLAEDDPFQVFDQFEN